MSGNPAFVSRAIASSCDVAARAFAEDPERQPNRVRNFLIRASHYWHGEAQEVIQVNASRESIMQAFVGHEVQLDLCEEIVRFKFAGSEERKGLTKLIEYAKEENLTENYAIDEAVKLLERCSQGYDV